MPLFNHYFITFNELLFFLEIREILLLVQKGEKWFHTSIFISLDTCGLFRNNYWYIEPLHEKIDNMGFRHKPACTFTEVG